MVLPLLSVLCGAGLLLLTVAPDRVFAALRGLGCDGIGLEFVQRNGYRFRAPLLVVALLSIAPLPIALSRVRKARTLILLIVRLLSHLDLNLMDTGSRVRLVEIAAWHAIAAVMLIPLLAVCTPIADFSLDDYPIEHCLDANGAVRSLFVPHLGHVMPGYRAEVALARSLFGLNPVPRALVAWLVLVMALASVVLVLRTLRVPAVGALAVVVLLPSLSGFSSVAAGFFSSSPYVQVLCLGAWALMLTAAVVRSPRPTLWSRLGLFVTLTLTGLIDNAGAWVLPAAAAVAVHPLGLITWSDARDQARKLFVPWAAATVLIVGLNVALLGSGNSRSNPLAGGSSHGLGMFALDAVSLIAQSLGEIAMGPLYVRPGGYALAALWVLVVLVALRSSWSNGDRSIITLGTLLLISVAIVHIGRPGLSMRGANSQHLWTVAAWCTSMLGVALGTAWSAGTAARFRSVELLLGIIVLVAPARGLGWLTAKSDWAYRRGEARAVRSIGMNLVAPLARLNNGIAVAPNVRGSRLCQVVPGLSANPFDLSVYSPFLKQYALSLRFLPSTIDPDLGDETHGNADLRSALNRIRLLAQRNKHVSRLLIQPRDLTIARHPFNVMTIPIARANVREESLTKASLVRQTDGSVIEFWSEGMATYWVSTVTGSPHRKHLLEVAAWSLPPASEVPVEVRFDGSLPQRLGASWIVLGRSSGPNRAIVVDMLDEPAWSLSAHVRNVRLVFRVPGRYRLMGAQLLTTAPSGLHQVKFKRLPTACASHWACSVADRQPIRMLDTVHHLPLLR